MITYIIQHEPIGFYKMNAPIDDLIDEETGQLITKFATTVPIKNIEPVFLHKGLKILHYGDLYFIKEMLIKVTSHGRSIFVLLKKV